MTSTNSLNGAGTLTGSLVMARVMSATLSGEGSLSSVMSLVSNMTATLAGSGDLTAVMSATLDMAATLAGQGDVSGVLSLLLPMIATLSGSGSLTADLRGNADLFAHIYVNSGTASVGELVSGVWDALAASYNSPGTMGEKMNDAGSASNPWTEIIESGYTAAEILRLIAAASVGKTSGQPNAPVFRDIADTKDRIIGTVDSNGNRTGVTLDET